MAVPLSTVASAFGLTANIASLVIAISDFVSRVRDAQKDLDLICSELKSIDYALGFLTTDDSSPAAQIVVPLALEPKVAGALSNLDGVVKQIQACLGREGDMRLSRRIRWTISGRDEIEKLRSSLEVHKSALDLTLDLLSLHDTAVVWSDTEAIRVDTNVILTDGIPLFHRGHARIFTEIAQLRLRLNTLSPTPEDVNTVLQRYLDHVTNYAKTIIDANSVIEDASTMDDDTLVGKDAQNTEYEASNQTPSTSVSIGTRYLPEAISFQRLDSRAQVSTVSTPVEMLHANSNKRTFPDHAAIARARSRRMRLADNEIIDLDLSLWTPAKTHRDVFPNMLRRLEAGADPNPEQASPMILFSPQYRRGVSFGSDVGLVWRMVHLQLLDCLHLALRFGANPIQHRFLDSETMTPLSYCREVWQSDAAANLLLRAGAGPEDERLHVTRERERAEKEEKSRRATAIRQQKQAEKERRRLDLPVHNQPGRKRDSWSVFSKFSKKK